MLKLITRRLDVRVWTELTGLRTGDIGGPLWTRARTSGGPFEVLQGS
jgi:hypothetical protein